MPDIWKLGQVRDAKFGTNASNKIAVNVVEFQGFIFHRFWVVKEKTTGRGEVKLLLSLTQIWVIVRNKPKARNILLVRTLIVSQKQFTLSWISKGFLYWACSCINAIRLKTLTMIPLSDTTKKAWQDEKGKETSEVTLSITNPYLIKNVDTQNKGKNIYCNNICCSFFEFNILIEVSNYAISVF